MYEKVEFAMASVLAVGSVVGGVVAMLGLVHVALAVIELAK